MCARLATTNILTISKPIRHAVLRGAPPGALSPTATAATMQQSWHHTMMDIAHTTGAASAGMRKTGDRPTTRRHAAGVPSRHASPIDSAHKSRRLTRPNRPRQQQSRVHRRTLQPLWLPTDWPFRTSYRVPPPAPPFPCCQRSMSPPPLGHGLQSPRSPIAPVVAGNAVLPAEMGAHVDTGATEY